MAAGTYRDTLRLPGLMSFLVTQFLGAFNDNFSKIIVSFVAMSAYGEVNGVTIVGAAFILPFLLFSGYAGHLADTVSKTRVLVAVKAFEIAVMALAVPGLLTGHTELLVAVVFLMGVHSTFFSPSKYGIVPELVPAEHMSAANGLLEMSTFAAIVLGTGFGGMLFERFAGEPLVLGGALVAIAVIGFLTSLGIRKMPAANPSARMSWNPWGEVWLGTKRLWPDVTLWGTVLGIAYFWFLGALLQTALLPFGQEVLHVGKEASSRLYTPLAFGIATGSLVAGRLSGGKIELGLVPVGSLGLALFALTFAWSSTYVGAALNLTALGFFGGFFAVPLNALLQHRPADQEKGRVQATNNFLQTIGILLAIGLIAQLNAAGLSIQQIVVIAGALTVLVNIYILVRLPDFFVRFSLWMLTHTIYRIRIVGRPHIPERGPALLIANHVSMIDGLLVGACIQRFVRFLVYGPYYRKPLIHTLLSRMHAIPIGPTRKEIVDAIAKARAELAAGHVVCIFAEGAISRTGNLLPFKRGFERIVEGLDVPIVPIYLDRVWGSIFSFKDGKFIWKWPERLPYPVTVTFGDPLPSSATAIDVRQRISELGTVAIRERRTTSDLLHTEFAGAARKHWGKLAMADSTGQSLTYGRSLIGAIALGRVLARKTPGQTNVGTLLPASVGGALTNLALFFAKRTPVNLNFTIGPEALKGAIEQAGITTIVTSKRFLQKAEIAELPGMIFLENLRGDVSGMDKAIAFLHARLVPRRYLRHRYGGREVTTHSLATIIFSSGSTGIPKGVMLTHANLLANVDSITQIFPMGPNDCFIGVLPFFHSFGFLGTFWFPLLRGASVAYHPNPMDAKTVGELAEKYKATMLISTPTFCGSYLRRCTKEQFAHLRYAIVGAEKLREPLATEFREKYGIPLLEGYGMTEMAPVVAANRPNIDDPHEQQVGTKPGSVGHAIPGVAAKVVDRDTGVDVPVGEEGLLLVKGPNLMLGYLHAPEKTAEVMRDGWYVTGDIAKLDEDGFIYITDRLSRFSKIGGEMVPHVRVEDAINAAIGEIASVVTAVPDESKGERLVAFYVSATLTPELLWERLTETDLPRLWIPKRDSLLPIEAIPTLGTGKVDLRRVKELAREQVSEGAARRS